MRKVKILIALIFMSIIFMPKVHGYEIGREVYVRHIDKDGGNIISGIQNIDQVLQNSDGNVSLIANSSSPDVESGSYSEYYNFDLSSIMTISKSLVILNGGYNYSYLGYVRRTDVSYDVALGYAENQRKAIISGTGTYDVEYDSRDNSTTMYTFPQKNENDVTIIDFYYSRTSTEDVSVKLRTKSSATPSDATLINTEVTYVPANAQLFPYYEAPKYYATELSYKKIIEDNKIKYAINNYIVNVARAGSMYNSSPVEKEGKIINGNVIGNGQECVIGGVGSSISFNVGADIGSLVSGVNLNPTEKVENYNTRTNQDLITGATLAQSDFPTSGWNVTFTAYNGLRSAKGTLTYETYNVLTGQVIGTVDKQSTNDHFINVYTPIKLDVPEVVITSESDIDHSTTSASTIIMSDDATFEIRLKCSDSNFFNGVSEYDKSKFVDKYYLVFDFDVIHNGRIYPKGTAIRMTNTAITMDGITYFHGQVAPNETLSRDSSNHKIIVLAAASNMPDTSTGLLQEVVDQEVETQMDGTRDVSNRKYINDSGDNEVAFSNSIKDAVQYNASQYTGGHTMYADGYYFAMKTVVVRTVSRIYDFRITDCTDLAYKSTFRNANNELLKNNYYSGTRRLFVYTNGSNKEYTSILTRDNNDLYIYGTSSTKTLPLGPYKHNTATYTKAPKLGYRIAFDVKTSGYYLADGNDATSRRIVIKPSYYYISKDGNTLIKDINLYYKDASGKYKNYEGSNYTIYFTPNDGYRTTNNSTTSNVSSMSTKSVGLNLASSLGEFYLTDSMMSSDDSNYIQSWYGEFKLPNTTIAVKKGEGVNNALTDGYIGVKFDITCSDTVLNETISYNSEDKKAASKINTSQWDYEGYLGFANPGQPINTDSSLRLQLEKGIWVVNTQDVYDFVKGTVVLYDTDERAADDIQ